MLNQPMVTQIINQIGLYPIYSVVELNTGERGIVTTLNPKQLLRPVVLMYQDKNKQPYPIPMPLNFASRTIDDEPLEIVRVIDPEEHQINVEEFLSDWMIC